MSTTRALKPKPQQRSSENVREHIRATEADREAMSARIADLDRKWDTVLRTGDDARAERHEAEAAKARRGVTRAGLLLIDLAEELKEAEAVEEAAARFALRKEAEQAVAAAETEKRRYAELATEIAGILGRYATACDLAQKAGIAGPDSDRRTPGIRTPEREETYQVFVDEHGNETSTPFPAGVYAVAADGSNIDPLTGAPPKQRPSRTRVRIIPGTLQPGHNVGALSAMVSLPGVAIDDPYFWPASQTE
jgi:hypothetical protein